MGEDVSVHSDDGVPGRNTAHETADEAEAETLKILDLYTEVCESVLAMPVLKGRKSDSEKFAGALRTYSIEALRGDGRALQAGTSHNLGQNFAKAFDISFQARDRRFSTSGARLGVTTRLGGVIMVHGDDSGPSRRRDQRHTRSSSCPSAATTGGNGAPNGRGHSPAARRGVRVIDERDERPGYFRNGDARRAMRLEIGPKDREVPGAAAAIRARSSACQSTPRARVLNPQRHQRAFERAVHSRRAHPQADT
jgi:prolyl-tRNA synthetase